MANRKRHSCGVALCFHGAFARRGDAQTKAEKVKGRVISRRIGRDWRYVVVTGKKGA